MKSKKITKKQLELYIMEQVTEKEMFEIIELLRARKAILDLDKIAQEKLKVLEKVKKL